MSPQGLNALIQPGSITILSRLAATKGDSTPGVRNPRCFVLPIQSTAGGASSCPSLLRRSPPPIASCGPSPSCRWPSSPSPVPSRSSSSRLVCSADPKAFRTRPAATAQQRRYECLRIPRDSKLCVAPEHEGYLGQNVRYHTQIPPLQTQQETPTRVKRVGLESNEPAAYKRLPRCTSEAHPRLSPRLSNPLVQSRDFKMTDNESGANQTQV